VPSIAPLSSGRRPAPPTVRTPTVVSSFLSPCGETPTTGAAERPNSGEPTPLHRRLSMVDWPYAVVHGRWTKSTIFQYKNNSEFLENPNIFTNSPLTLVLNKNKTSLKLQFPPLNFTQITVSTHVFLHRSPLSILHLQICPWTFPKFQFSLCNFEHPYLSNRNSESGDSCGKILRITSSFSLNYFYAYHYCICLIVCLSIRRIHFGAIVQRLSRSSIQGLWSFLLRATRQVSLNILHQYTFMSIL
jgi:hypothetical protein